jgi:four helix bundle protein
VDKVELIKRTKKFAIRVFKLVEQLPKTEASKVITYQLLKSSSSVAENYRAVNKAKSKKDFSNKIKVVLEESDESNFWLTFILDLELLQNDNTELRFLIKESDEFVAIFTSSLKTLNNNSVDNKSQIINLKSKIQNEFN